MPGWPPAGDGVPGDKSMTMSSAAGGAVAGGAVAGGTVAGGTVAGGVRWWPS